MIERVTGAHLGPIWYHSEFSGIPYSSNQFLGWYFFCHLQQNDYLTLDLPKGELQRCVRIHMCNLWLYVGVHVRAKSILRGACDVCVCVARFRAGDVQSHFLEENS